MKTHSIPLFVAEIEAYGGAERSMVALSRWLYEHGIENHILTYEDRLGLARYASHPLTVVQLKPSGGFRAKVAALKAARLQDGPKPLASGYQPALHLTLAGVRGFHCLMHDTPSLFGDAQRRSWKTKLRIGISNRLIGHGLRSGGVTTVNSERLQRETQENFNVRARIVRMGGLLPAEQSGPHPVDGIFRMLSVCRIEENKRIDWMIRSLAMLEKADAPLSALIPWQLDVVGKGTLIASLQQLAEQMGVGDRIHFRGFLPDEDVEAMYRKAHLFLMPAVQGYGIPALESLYRSVPVVLHRESGVSDILRETPWAFVFEGGEDNFTTVLRKAIPRILAGAHCSEALPQLPTEDSWAEECARVFGYYV